MGDHPSRPPVPRWLERLPGSSAGHLRTEPVRLAPGGVWRAAVSPRRWWALTPPFHPYRPAPPETRRQAVCSLFHFPSAFAAWGFPSALALRCPDFPRTACAARGHPACKHSVARGRRNHRGGAVVQDGTMPREPPPPRAGRRSSPARRSPPAAAPLRPQSPRRHRPILARRRPRRARPPRRADSSRPAVASRRPPRPSPSAPPGSEPKPPPIVLVTDAGRQEAVQGSYCVTQVSESGEGQGACADAAFVASERAEPSSRPARP